jgi:hypothetical protein
MSKISELSDGGSLVSSDYLIAVRSGGNVKVRMDQINVDQVDLGDNEFIRLGNSQDLTMVHTSTQSIINQAGIGDLLIQKAGSTKLTINASGIDVTGSVTASSGITATTGTFSGAGSFNTTANDAVTANTSFATPTTLGLVTLKRGGVVKGYLGLSPTEAGAALLDSAGAVRVEANATGIDVTGTVTAGGATFSGDVNIDKASPILIFKESAAAKLFIGESSAVGGGAGYYDFYAVTGLGQRFFTNSVERMRIDASGNLYLGATSGARGSASTRQLTKLGAGQAYLEIQSASTSSTDDGILFSDGSGGNYGLVGYNHNSDALNFFTASAERMRIDASGNVGISESNPVAKIHIKGSGTSGQVTSSLILENSSSGTAGLQITGTAGSSHLDFMYGGGPSTGTNTLTTGISMTLEGSGAGNVGIGVSPSAKLHVLGGRSTFYSGDNYAVGVGNASGVLGGYMGSPAVNVLSFSEPGGVERMRIDASGNLLVGTTNSANLASATPNVVTDESFGINDGTNIAAIGVDRINFNAGQYYVLNETNDGVKLVNGATSWTSQSDENSKENIVELSSALTAVKAMRCVRYNLKSQNPDDVKIGFIAQDWQSSYPEVVATDTDGTLGMNYTETIPVLLKAIQEQQAIIEALTARVAALES